jgi:hypothetical protein
MTTKKPFRWTKRANQLRRVLEHPDAPPAKELREEVAKAIREHFEAEGARPSEIAMSISRDLELFDQVATFLGKGAELKGGAT